MRVYLCEDSVDGIFTGVYDAWASRLGHDNVRLLALTGEVYEPELFCEYEYVKADAGKAEKVLKTVRSRISEYAARMLIRACCAEDIRKADDIYRVIVLGLRCGRRTADQLTNPHVMAVFERDRQIGNEAHHYLGFLRFSRIREELLFAEYEPKGDITAIIAPHFADRLAAENFVICDRRRRRAAVHPAGEHWFMTSFTEEVLKKMEEYSSCGDEYRDLWKVFFKNIAIDERKNEKLQNNLLPKRYRSMMTEFKISE